AGALDGEVAYLLGPALGKHTLFTGGALDPTGSLKLTDPEALWSSAALAGGRRARREAVAKAVRAMVVSASAPHEVVVSGRWAGLPPLIAALSTSLQDVAPVIALA